MDSKQSLPNFKEGNERYELGECVFNGTASCCRKFDDHRDFKAAKEKGDTLNTAETWQESNKIWSQSSHQFQLPNFLTKKFC